MMPTRETLWMALCVGLALYILWMDARPYVIAWLDSRNRKLK